MDKVEKGAFIECRTGGNGIAHLKQNEDKTWTIQTIESHCEATAELAMLFAGTYGCAEIGYELGKMHDKGKETISFQEYIRNVSGLETAKDAPSQAPHAAIGAKVALVAYPAYKQLIAFPLLGHHAGLRDSEEADKILKEQVIPREVSPVKKNERLTIPHSWKGKVEPYEANHLTRMNASCLVDADRLDTERFMNPEQARLRTKHESLRNLAPLLERYLSQLARNAADTEVNRIRAEIQKECVSHVMDPPGFFSLSVPTGGGKTLSSLAWAMGHALAYGKERIIIAIPYTSIVAQTAERLKEIFGENNVLEHHSSFDASGVAREDMDMYELATENWDYPIIVTTNVQLFESMYSNRPSKFRKIHNICNSVVILDEAQSLPIEFLRPILEALNTYQHLFLVSVLFTTASIPVLDTNVLRNGVELLKGLPKIRELVPESMDLPNRLKRVELHFDSSISTYGEIAERIGKYRQVLCIVNTRKNAREVFNQLPGAIEKVHLSRMMCPQHIKKAIGRIRKDLQENRPVIVVSTQLIEAGVDIDFPVVFRERAGLDSIIQAAGRCNREGTQEKGDTYVFSFETIPQRFMTWADNARKALGDTRDWFRPETIREYFVQLYARVPTFDKEDIHSLLATISEMHFETAGERFKLIQDDSVNVVMPYPGYEILVDQIRRNGVNYKNLKEISQYSVGVRKRDFEKLRDKGLVEAIVDDMYMLVDCNRYNNSTGLILDDFWPEEPLMI
ncbi:MAG: CRISPR-associated helicase Cas3' [Sphaerochaetaceae bacterium]|nr:CRISPR-associated helicase Cas3' [Spirochaetales bacterium]MDY5500713.1 CRISPR-associated helicase Cas3' [Sphaerochaetaceae bacterium]